MAYLFPTHSATKKIENAKGKKIEAWKVRYFLLVRCLSIFQEALIQFLSIFLTFLQFSVGPYIFVWSFRALRLSKKEETKITVG